MTPDGRFRRGMRPPLAWQIGRTALLSAVGVGGFIVALLALGFALALVPVALGAGLVAWLAVRLQIWLAGAPAGGPRHLRRPY
ncbi:MAG: hypothetical protein JOY71_05075 [Acetobacteraceae bacterium]|nr:hypothetical protein [Acetobacteraceae bacterium]MBV8521493.1 hypothetical protein [Acetobacteraceae bacterium]MBV8591522.1 hypothetical protein [Acetobacteraceae bacterium]